MPHYNTRFIKKIPPSGVSPSFKLSLPHKIGRTDLSGLIGEEFSLSTSPNSDKTWPASIIARQNKGRAEYSLKGWKLFAEAHNVDQGDQYSFEMVEDDSGQSRLVIQLLTKAGQAGVDIQAEAEAREQWLQGPLDSPVILHAAQIDEEYDLQLQAEDVKPVFGFEKVVSEVPRSAFEDEKDSVMETGAIINDLCDNSEPLDPTLLDYFAAIRPLEHLPTTELLDNADTTCPMDMVPMSAGLDAPFAAGCDQSFSGWHAASMATNSMQAMNDEEKHMPATYPPGHRLSFDRSSENDASVRSLIHSELLQHSSVSPETAGLQSGWRPEGQSSRVPLAAKQDIDTLTASVRAMHEHIELLRDQAEKSINLRAQMQEQTQQGLQIISDLEGVLEQHFQSLPSLETEEQDEEADVNLKTPLDVQAGLQALKNRLCNAIDMCTRKDSASC